MEKIFTATRISKAFPGVLANDDVSFSVVRGDIHALLGENGAGKSTLMKILYGVLQPDAGAMELEGKPYVPQSPAAAREAGVGMVFQHFSLFEAMSVSENIALGLPGAQPDTAFEDRIRQVSQEYGLPVAPSRIVGDLSVGERQRVEIVRCLMQSPRLLIMDEPTSVLTPQEAEDLFRTLKNLQEAGLSILYISHRLSEIQGLCQSATVMRGGRIVATCDPREETTRSLAEMMIGATLVDPVPATRDPGPVRLSVENMIVPADKPFGVRLEDVSFTVRSGEILGIGGVAGNGQSELMEALIGECPVASGAILLDGTPLTAMSPTGRRLAGLAFAPEERLGHAISPGMSLTENAFISARQSAGLARHGVFDFNAATRFAKGVIDRFDVRTSGPSSPARTLSGGNLQKYSVGREIAQQPKVLIVAQPTWGVDAAAAAVVHQSLIALAEDGSAVVVISQDLDELRRLTHRLAILSDGVLSRARPTFEMSVAEIGALMGGSMLEEGIHASG